jgi:hypothetical protein
MPKMLRWLARRQEVCQCTKARLADVEALPTLVARLGHMLDAELRPDNVRAA